MIRAARAGRWRRRTRRGPVDAGRPANAVSPAIAARRKGGVGQPGAFGRCRVDGEGTPCETRHRQVWPATRRRPERGPGRGNAAPGDAASSADTAHRADAEGGSVRTRHRRTGSANAAPANAAREGKRSAGERGGVGRHCADGKGDAVRTRRRRNGASERGAGGKRGRDGEPGAAAMAARADAARRETVLDGDGCARRRDEAGAARTGALLLRVPNAGRRFANSPPVGAFPRGVEDVGGTRWGTRRGWGRSLDADAPLAPTRANPARGGGAPLRGARRPAVLRRGVFRREVFPQGSAQSGRLPLRRPPSGGLPCRGALRQVFSVGDTPSGGAASPAFSGREGRERSVRGGADRGSGPAGGGGPTRGVNRHRKCPTFKHRKCPTPERGGPRGRRRDRVGWWSARHGRGWRRWRRHGSRCEPGLRWMAPGSD